MLLFCNNGKTEAVSIFNMKLKLGYIMGYQLPCVCQLMAVCIQKALIFFPEHHSEIRPVKCASTCLLSWS